jgi:hypothetical protein
MSPKGNETHARQALCPRLLSSPVGGREIVRKRLKTSRYIFNFRGYSRGYRICIYKNISLITAYYFINITSSLAKKIIAAEFERRFTDTFPLWQSISMR